MTLNEAQESNKRINKELIEFFPYLQPRNIWTDKVPEDYDYSCILGWELPEGWGKLFLQMCGDIKKPLIDSGCLDKFRFIQIKEKFNGMRCYTSGAPKEVQDIIRNYEYVSHFVCTICGKPAKYETRQGWIAGYCEDCIHKIRKENDIEDCKILEFNPIMHVEGWKNGNSYFEDVDVSNIWDELYRDGY